MFHATLDTKVLSIAGMATVPFSSEIAGYLTYKDRYDNPVVLYERPENATWMLVPRGVVNPYNAVVDGRTTNNLGAINCKMPPRYADNARCVKESLSLLQNGIDHITEAPTGWGKTYHGCAVAAALGEATLIVVTKNDLIQGWHKTLINLIGVPADQIGHVQQNKCLYKGKRFVIAMVHSLVAREYEPEFYKNFGLVIFDEVHRLGADYFEQVCRLFPAMHRLGLSATPKRKDGRFKSFEAHIGPVKVRGINVPMSPKIVVKQTGWKVPSFKVFDGDKGQYVYKEMPFQAGKLGAVVKRMGSDAVRNQEIAEFVKQAYDAGRHILVLSDLIDGHLKLLFHVIAKAGVPGNEIDYYIGGRTQADLDAAKKARVVLATYSFTTEGTDVPHWDTLVMATPKASVAQAIGRVMRFVEGKKTPVVLDLVDDHAVFRSYANSRLKDYFNVKAEIVKV